MSSPADVAAAADYDTTVAQFDADVAVVLVVVVAPDAADSWESHDRVLMESGVCICLCTCTYSMSQKKPLGFSGIFPKRLGIFRSNSKFLLHFPIYAIGQIFI